MEALQAWMNTNCANCQTPLQGPVCHHCGQVHQAERWNVPGLIRQFLQQITNIEKGFLYTLRTMLTRPEQLIKEYWQGVTIKAYQPFRYMLILVAVNLLINFSLGIDDLLQAQLQPSLVDEQFGAEEIAAADQQFDTWLNALVLLLLPAFALLTKWLFSNAQKNYAEHLIFNAFMIGQQSAITSVTHFLFYLVPPLFAIYLPFNFAIGVIYNSYVYRRLFENSWWLSIGKAILIGLIGLVVFFGLIGAASAIALWL